MPRPAGKKRPVGRPARHGYTIDKTKTGTVTPTYCSWQAMKTRCTNPNQKDYKHYGGRGITYCERWDVFDNFLEDMGERPSRNHVLSRIDHEGNYEPGNVEWADKRENNREAVIRRWRNESSCQISV